MARNDTPLDDVKTKVQDLGQDAAAAARAKVDEAAHAAQSRATAEVSAVANAADAASDELPSGSIQAQMADQVAAGAEYLAQSVADMDVNAVTQQITDFARRNPLVFIGGAALAGVALSRFLKARDPSPIAQTYSDDDPWHSRDIDAALGGFDVPS